MNTLSWLIYAAGVLDSVNFGLSFAFFCAVGCIPVAWFARGVTSANVMEYDYPTEHRPDGSRDYRSWQTWVTATRRKALYVVPAAFYVVVAVLPSSKTVWLVAASEAGETIVTSPDAIEMMGDLKAIIKQRLKNELGSDRP